MTSAVFVQPGAAILRMPELLGQQIPAIRSPARFKVVRAGARAGKDVLDFEAAVLGHGPLICPHAPGACQRQLTQGTTCWAGLVHGWDIVWLAPDYPQGTIVWKERIRPKFEALSCFRLNDAEHTATLQGRGTFWLKSYENVRSIRGMGERLGGIVCNEAAWYDLEDAWTAVLLPRLMDRQGWAIFSSTTNAGMDGNSQHRVPSFFNQLCGDVMSGRRSASEWAHFHWTAQENPAISARGFRQLVAEYQADSPRLREEVYAELLEAGSGLALPWEPSVHVLKRWQPAPEGMGERYIAGMDWGLHSPHKSVIALGAVDIEGNIVWYKEFVWTDKEAYQAGSDWAQDLVRSGPMVPWPSILWADGSMWAQGPIGGRSIGDEFREGVDAVLGRHTIPIQAGPHGPKSRQVKLSVMQRMLRWGPRLADGTVPVTRLPRMRFVGSGCPYLCQTLPTLPYAKTTFSDVETTGVEDHGYDCVGQVLLQELETPAAPLRVAADSQHPGFMADGRRRPRVETWESRREEELVRLRQLGVKIGGRYGQRPGKEW